jgi:hypothetical protein
MFERFKLFYVLSSNYKRIKKIIQVLIDYFLIDSLQWILQGGGFGDKLQLTQEILVVASF